MFTSKRIISQMAVCLTAYSSSVYSDTYQRQPAIDAKHYRFELRLLSDDSNRIQGKAAVTLRIIDPSVKKLFLDLTSLQDSGTGMVVTNVSHSGNAVAFKHKDNRLYLPIPKGTQAEQQITYIIHYEGVPGGGLRLMNNLHGERTAFSENWHNNARQWLPTIDHLSDKATGEFIIETKADYQVIATGKLLQSRDVTGGLRRTHWQQAEPIASWLYAIGIAHFVVAGNAIVRGTPMSYWAFPQDDVTGLKALKRDAQGSFEFFAERIAPYPYAKLAHVQAAGVGGGTEHATNIFYGESDVADGRAPTVHETAHQWFGNSVTASDWDDVWLSEGFATYLALLYFEHTYGRDDFLGGIRRARDTVINYEHAHTNTPLVHNNLDEVQHSPLNPLVYEKGAWVLHMLRRQLGTDVFWQGLREYYKRHQHGLASSQDLRIAMEHVSGQQLATFFEQWLYRSGVPKIAGSWHYNSATKEVVLEIHQTQDSKPFQFELQLGFVHDGDYWPEFEKIQVSQRATRVALPLAKAPSSVILDPNVWLLAEFGEFIHKPSH